MADELDDLIAKRRKALASAPVAAPADDVSTLIAQRRAALKVPEPGLGSRILSGIGDAATQIVTHPIDTMRSIGRSALTDLSTIGENMNAGMGQPNQNTPQIAARLPGALARTSAAAAFPGIESAVASKVGGGALGTLAGTATAGAVGGAVNNPHDPLVGAATGATLAAGIGGAGKVVGRVADATGVPALVRGALPRPASRAAMPGSLSPLRSTQELAQADALKQMGRARLSLDELAEKAKSAHPDEMFVDLVGQPAVDRAGGAVATPSTGSGDIVKALDARAQRAPKAVRQAASDALGVGRENTVLAQRSMNAERQAAAKPLYDAAYAGKPISDPAVLETMQLPAFQNAYKRGQRIAKLEGVDLPPLANGTGLPVQAIDYAKRGLDDLIESKMKSGGMGKAEARALRQRLNGVLETVDAQVPDYKAARAQFAGDSKAIDAHELGQSFMRAKTDELAAMWPTMSEAEQAAYRSGAIASIEDAVRGKTDGFNPVRDFRDDIMRDNLRVIMPSQQAADEFLNTVEKFHKMHGNRAQIVGNSKTASRLAQREEEAGGLEHAASAIAHPVGALHAIVKSALAQRLRGLSEAQVDALAPILTAHGDALSQVIQDLRAAQATQGRRNPLAARALAPRTSRDEQP